MSARTLRQATSVFSQHVRLQLSVCGYGSDTSSVNSSSEPPAPKNPVQPEDNAEDQRCDPTKYNAEQLFHYTPWSFYDTELELSLMRLPRQSSIKSSPDNKK